MERVVGSKRPLIYAAAPAQPVSTARRSFVSLMGHRSFSVAVCKNFNILVAHKDNFI